MGWWHTKRRPRLHWHARAKYWPSCLVRGDVRDTPALCTCCRLISASRAADMALPDLRGGQQLSTKFIDKPVRICRGRIVTMLAHHFLLLQMLQRFVDLAARAIRMDMAKPRIMENDFDHVQATPDGSLTVQNARFKTRIRSSTQVCCISRCMGTRCTRSNVVPS